MKEQDKNKILDALIQAGLSKDEAVAVLHVIEQNSKAARPHYNIEIKR